MMSHRFGFPTGGIQQKVALYFQNVRSQVAPYKPMTAARGRSVSDACNMLMNERSDWQALWSDKRRARKIHHPYQVHVHDTQAFVPHTRKHSTLVPYLCHTEFFIPDRQAEMIMSARGMKKEQSTPCHAKRGILPAVLSLTLLPDMYICMIVTVVDLSTYWLCTNTPVQKGLTILPFHSQR